jgi:hypothetical protein
LKSIFKIYINFDDCIAKIRKNIDSKVILRIFA